MTAARATLIREGSRLLRRNGYAATGLKELLERAGVPKGSFYHHFGSKEEFAVAVVEAYYGWHDDRLTELAAKGDEPGLERLLGYFELLLEHATAADPAVRGCLLAMLALETAATEEALPEAVEHAFDRWHARLGKLVADAQREGRIGAGEAPETLAALLLDAWEGALMRARLAQDVAPLRACLEISIPRILEAGR